MKRYLRSALSIIYLGLFTTCLQADPILDDIKQSKILKICTTGDYPPLTYQDNKTLEYSGEDIDRAKALANHLGVTPVFIRTTWPTLTQDLLAGKCHFAVGGISITQERSKHFIFSKPYLKGGKVPITLCLNKTRFNDFTAIDQPSVRIVTNPGGTNQKFVLNHIKHAQVIVHPDNKTIFTMLLTDKADVMFTDLIEAQYQAKQHPELCVIHPDQPLTVEYKAFMLPQNATDLVQIIDQSL